MTIIEIIFAVLFLYVLNNLRLKKRDVEYLESRCFHLEHNASVRNKINAENVAENEERFIGIRHVLTETTKYLDKLTDHLGLEYKPESIEPSKFVSKEE